MICLLFLDVSLSYQAPFPFSHSLTHSIMLPGPHEHLINHLVEVPAVEGPVRVDHLLPAGVGVGCEVVDDHLVLGL